MIDILTSEDMENRSLCIFQYLTLYYTISHCIFAQYIHICIHTKAYPGLLIYQSKNIAGADQAKILLWGIWSGERRGIPGPCHQEKYFEVESPLNPI